MPSLSVSRLVKVNVILAAIAAQSQNLSTLLVLTSTDVIDVVERLRSYTTLADVANDFGTVGPEYACAVLAFQQQPQAAQIKFGRWAKTATAGKLIGGPLSSANQAIGAWTAITTGSLKIGVDAVAPVDVTGLDFSAETNLNGVASVLQAGIRAANAAFAAVTVKYNSVYSRFEIESGTTGTSSKITFAAAAATGTDVSAMLAMESTSGGAYVADGIAAETALAAATLFDSQFGRTWYALTIPEAVDADQIAVAGYIEGSTNKHLFGVTSQDAGCLSSVSTTDVAYQLKALAYSTTVTQYSSENAYAVVSLLAKAISTNWAGNNTAITLMYKTEPGIVAESLTETQAQALSAKDANVFVNYDNSTAIIQDGKVASGDFIDTITGAHALAVDIQTEVYNLLYTSPTKIPQTDAGTNQVVAAISRVCGKYVTDGFLAPGTWDQTGFGTLNQGDFIEAGYYIYAPTVASQLKADRQARKLVPIQIAAKCAGAVHTVDLQLNISR